MPLLGRDLHNDLETDDSDLTDGSSFGSDSHLNDALAHSLRKGYSGAKSPRGERKEAWLVDPNGEGSVGSTDDNASQSVVSPPHVSGSCWGKDKGDNLHSLRGVNKAMRSPQGILLRRREENSSLDGLAQGGRSDSQWDLAGGVRHLSPHPLYFLPF